jgi:zinc protease
MRPTSMLVLSASLLAAHACTLAAPQSALAAVAGAAEPLPSDPALVTGQLENGLKYIIRKHANPAARAGIWIHISSGSLNESEKTRGIAHFLEHMAFNGSANFPPGTVVDYFQSLGMAFGRDQNAFTSFDQTTYQLYLPDVKSETIDKALLFFSDVAGRLLLSEKEIESERGIIQEERRTRLGPAQRIQEYIQERLAPESTFGRRSPIGTEATINSVSKADFEGYYKKNYVASNMTVIVVADADPAPIAEQIKKQFSSLPKVPRPADEPVGVQGTKGTRAIVATDPEVKQASISMTRIEPPRGPTLTTADERRDLVELIGTWALNRRIEAEIAAGKASFLSAFTSTQSLANTLRVVSAQANGKPEDWKKMLTELGTHVQRARLHGFTEQEVDDARKTLLSQAEEGVQRESTIPARAMLARINGDVAAGEPVMAAQQRLDLHKKLLPGISAKEVSEAFTKEFDPANVIFVLTAPTSGDNPSEAQLIELGRAAFDVKPEKAAEVARAASLLEKAPTPGTLGEVAQHQASSVTSGWLSNGAAFHHRFMDVEKNSVSITITLAGGQIQETAANRGITDAASLAWERQASSKLSSTQIRDLMTGKKIRVRGGDGGGGPRGGGGGAAGQDTMRISISGNPGELDIGFQLAHLMLTDPVVEPAALEQWKKAQKQAIEQRKVQPQGAIQEMIANAFYPKSEARLHPLTTEQVDAITVEAAQAWLKKLIAESPIEVAVVGDLPLDQAKAYVEKYIGSLPKRERISDKTLANLRTIERPKGPMIVEKTMDVQTPLGIVLDGFFATDAKNVRDSRLIQMAARILSTRMVKVVREEKQLVYSIGAQAQPGQVFPGYGLFLATAPTEPGKAPALAATLEEMYADFAKSGPTEDEIVVARKQMANQLDEQMKEPGFWTGRTAGLTYRGASLDDVMAAPEAFQKFTAEEIRECFARYFKPEARFRFVVTPAAKADAPAKPEGADKKPA